jgi:enoyl-CoA hydratase
VEALRIGLVAELTDREALPQRALEGARQIASLSPWGVRLTKQGMWSALELPSQQSAIEYEDRQQIMGTFGRAPAEAVDAFLHKRDAEFAD